MARNIRLTSYRLPGCIDLVVGSRGEVEDEAIGALASICTDLSLTALNKFLLPGLKKFLDYLWYTIEAKTYSFQNL